MTREDAITICKNIIRSIKGDTCYINYSKEQDKEAIETLLDIIYKQQEEIKELKLITNTYNSYEGKDMDHTKIIIADSNYFINGTFVKKFVSKDKIRDKIKEIENRRIEEGQCELALHGFIREGKIEVLNELLEE